MAKTFSSKNILMYFKTLHYVLFDMHISGKKKEKFKHE